MVNKALVMGFSWPDKTELSRNAFRIVRALRGAGYEAFIAGGAVRDALLKRAITEIDIATSARPEAVEKLFKKTIPTGKKHGTVTVREDGISYEVTTFRVEGPYERYRRPIAVKFVASAEEDAKRRDFTVNALFYDVEKKAVLDYVQGIAGLSHKRIILVGDPQARIKEDALRMLRAIRFSTLLEFELPKETRMAIMGSAKLIKKISAERVKQELDRIMLSGRGAVALGLMDVVGLLEYVLPEVKKLQGVEQPKNQHSEGDVYAHSLLALEKVNDQFDLPTRYAVLFHDLGKPATKKLRSGKITFYDHQKVGAEIARRLCRRLRFSNSDAEKTTWLVKNHMVPSDFVNMKLATRRKWGLNEYFPDLLKVYLADVSASLPPSGRADTNPHGYREGLKILQEIKSQPVLRVPLLSGNEIMKVLRIKEGPRVGKVLKYFEEKKLAGGLKTKQAALNFLRANKKYLQKI